MKHLTLFALPLTILLALAACGGGDDEVTPTPFVPPGGVNTSLPRHLTSVTPEQESTVTNADLNVGGEATDGGICAGFSFTTGETMGDDPTSRVTLIVASEDVTTSAVWQVTASEPPTGGSICYAPPQPFEPGEQTVTVRYSDATDRQFIYNWTFTVTGSAASESP